jgi:hypothetical protein
VNRKAFGLIHTWPDLRNAEYEVVQRIIAASKALDIGVVLITDSGKIIWASPELNMKSGSDIRDGDIEFIISLHFFSPRLIDVYSYITLWQPIQFYHQFGYSKSIDAVTSHNDLISCDSDLTDNHGMNLLSSLRRAPSQPLPKMFHAVPEPFLPPLITSKSKLFYIGINWERLGRPKGRFHDTLVMLDDLDLIDIYGPKQVHGEQVWVGFQSYRGELPFDGVSVQLAAQRSGVCLALSSEAHKSAGIMSNRIFEGLAGGAAIIATPNPLIDKYFKDIVYIVDDEQGDDILGQQVLEALRQIRADPDEARRRVLIGQDILREHCSLEKSIAHLFNGHTHREAHFEREFLSEGALTLILTLQSGSYSNFERLMHEIANQKKVSISLKIVCCYQDAVEISAKADQFLKRSLKSIDIRPVNMSPASEAFDGIRPPRERSGRMIWDIIQEIETEYFGFLHSDNSLFKHHYASLINAIRNEPHSMASCSGVISINTDLRGVGQRELVELRLSDIQSVLHATGRAQAGRFLFKTQIADAPIGFLMEMLDGEEPNYFKISSLLRGPIAQSSYATYAELKGPNHIGQLPAEPLEQQQQYIRDSFANDFRWMEHVSRGRTVPAFPYTLSPAGPPRWHQSPPQSPPPVLHCDRPASMCSGGSGLRFLVSGFSVPEAGHIWLEGESGILEFSLPGSDGAVAVSGAGTGEFELSDFVLKIAVAGRKSNVTGREQHCTLAINNAVVGYSDVPDGGGLIVFPIPPKVIALNRSIRLEIIPDHREPVLNGDGDVIDSRLVSIMLKSLEVSRVGEVPPVIIETGRFYRCNTAGDGISALYKNFYAAEQFGAWMAGRFGSLRFSCRSASASRSSGRELYVEMVARKSQFTGNEQSVSIVVNGQEAQSFKLDGPPRVLKVPLNDYNEADGLFVVNVSVEHAEAVFDDNQKIIDPRLLGVGVIGFGIFDITDE